MDFPLLQANLNPEVCSACGGKCCKRAPGITHPRQWTGETLRLALLSGRYMVDFWEGDIEPLDELEQIYYVRPAYVGSTQLFEAGWGGPCTFLGDKGCTLSVLERPQDCLDLIPETHFNCGTEGKQSGVRRWRDHQDMIREVAIPVRAEHPEPGPLTSREEQEALVDQLLQGDPSQAILAALDLMRKVGLAR